MQLHNKYVAVVNCNDIQFDYPSLKRHISCQFVNYILDYMKCNDLNKILCSVKYNKTKECVTVKRKLGL